MEKYATINYSLSPLIVLKYRKEEPNDQEFDEHLAELKSLYTSDKPFVLIIDASEAAAYLSASHRIKMGNFLKEMKQPMQKCNMATAFIIPSLVVRGLLKVIFAIAPFPVTHQVVKDKQEAVDWLRTIAKDKKLGFNLPEKI